MEDDSATGLIARRDRILVLFDLSDTLFNSETGRPMPGAKELVAALHNSGIRMGIVTGGTALQAKVLLTMNGMDRYFPDNSQIVGAETSADHGERLKAAVVDSRSPKTGVTLSAVEVIVIDDRISRLKVVGELNKEQALMARPECHYNFIAVANGQEPRGLFEVNGYKPYRVFTDLKDAGRITEAIMNTPSSLSRQKRSRSLS
jgi:hydroxymethylpyrimidine pyrophosphatase-like HAD family hydrolase